MHVHLHHRLIKLVFLLVATPVELDGAAAEGHDTTDSPAPITRTPARRLSHLTSCLFGILSSSQMNG